MTAQEALELAEKELSQKPITAKEALLQAERELSKKEPAMLPYQFEGRGPGLYETPEQYLKPSMPYARGPGLFELPKQYQQPGTIKPQKPTEIFGPQLPEKTTMPFIPFSPIQPEQAKVASAFYISTGRQASKLIPPLHSFIEKSIENMPSGYKKELLDKHPGAQLAGQAMGTAGEFAAMIYAADAIGLFKAGTALTGAMISKGVPGLAAKFIGAGMPGGVIWSAMTELENLSDIMTGKKQPTAQTLLWEPAKSYAFGQMMWGGQVAGGPKLAMGLGGAAFGTRTLAPYVEKMWRAEDPEWKNLAIEMPISVALGMLVGYWGHEANAKAFEMAVKNRMVERSADFIQAHADIINKDPSSFMFATKYQGKPVMWGLDAKSQEIIRLGQANLSQRANAVNLARATVDHFFSHPSPSIKADFSKLSNIIRESPELISNMTADIEKGLNPTSALLKQTFEKVMQVPLHPAQAGRDAITEIELFLKSQGKAINIEKQLSDLRQGKKPLTEKAQELKSWIETHENIPLHPAEAAREEMRIAEIKFDIQQEMEKSFLNKIPWEEYTEGLTREEQAELAKINKQLEKLATPKLEQSKIPFIKPKEPSEFQRYLEKAEQIKNKKIEPIKPPATNEQKTLGHRLQRKQGLSLEQFKKLKTELTGVESMADMDKDQAQAIIDALKETKDKPKILKSLPKPKFKEPTLAQWPTSKYTYAQVLGLEPMMKDLFIAEIERTLESAKINKFADDVTRQLKKQASLGDRLAARIKNVPSKPVAWMRDLLNTYGDVEELPPIDAKNKEIFRQIRDLFRNLLKRENEVRDRLGREPIANVNAYVPLLFDQVTKEILRQIGELAIEPDPLKRIKDLDVPDDVKEWLRPRMPKKSFNPTEFARNHREELEKYFSKDLNRLIKWIGHYATREIWLSEPLEIFKGELEQAADTGQLPEATKDWAEAVVKFDIFKHPTANEQALRKTFMKLGGNLINDVLHPLNRHLSNPVNTLSYNTRKVVMTSALGGRPKMPIRNSLQRGLLLNLYPAKHFIKAQLGMGIPKEIKQQLRDTWLYRMEKRFEDYPDFKHHITEWLMMPYQLSHAGLWLGKVPISNVDVSMATGWLAGEELRTSPRYIKWAKKRAIKDGKPEDAYLRTPQDSIEEAIRAAFLTQWLYHPLFMPQVFRGQIGRMFASLTSWQQFLWFTHNRELLHVLFKGESYQGKPYPPYYRARSLLGYATFLGLMEGIRKSTGLDYTRFYLGPSITVLNPMGRLTLGVIMYATARNDFDRNYGKWLIKSSKQIFLPYGIGASEWIRWMTGEISTKEFLTFTEKKGSKLQRMFK